MADYLLYRARSIAESDPLADKILADHEIAFRPLIDFLHANGLFRDPHFGRNLGNWVEFELRASDLTDEGFELAKLCHHKWLQSLDRISIGEKTPEKAAKRMKTWQHELETLRGRGLRDADA